MELQYETLRYNGKSPELVMTMKGGNPKDKQLFGELERLITEKSDLTKDGIETVPTSEHVSQPGKIWTFTSEKDEELQLYRSEPFSNPSVYGLTYSGSDEKRSQIQNFANNKFRQNGSKTIL